MQCINVRYSVSATKMILHQMFFFAGRTDVSLLKASILKSFHIIIRHYEQTCRPRSGPSYSSMVISYMEKMALPQKGPMLYIHGATATFPRREKKLML